MDSLIHKGLTLEHWSKFTLLEQLANVGCDIERTIRWRNAGDLDHSKRAFERALELLTLTIMDPKNSAAARRELCRTREAIIDYFIYDNHYATSDAIWQNYFYDFGLAAAKANGK